MKCVYCLKVEAEDADSGDNARISYMIVDSVDGNHFTVEERTGAIFSGLKFDRENFSRFRFVVRASDAGSPPKTADVYVQVTIQDFNDISPRFVQVSNAQKNVFVMTSQCNSQLAPFFHCFVVFAGALRFLCELSRQRRTDGGSDTGVRRR